MNMQIIIPSIIVLAAACAVGYYLMQKRKKDATVPSYNQMPSVGSGWSFVYSNGVSGNASAFTFPKADGVHYIVTKAAGITMGKTITFRFSIAGDGELKVADPNDIPPATVRFLLWGQTVNDRWFTHVGTNLDHNGDYEVKVPIQLSKWTGVGGNPPTQQAPFESVIASPYAMGFTFGGQYFAGHGVYCPQGTRSFKLLEYSVA